MGSSNIGLALAAVGGIVTLGLYFVAVTRLKLIEPAVLAALLPGRRTAHDEDEP